MQLIEEQYIAKLKEREAIREKELSHVTKNKNVIPEKVGKGSKQRGK
jgi:hypothetical protein